VISGIVHVLKSGCRWDAPACYGPRKTLYNRFVR
jgi:transposase